jgi:hypothetical protein
MSAERRAELGKKWAELFADVEKSLNEEPAGPQVQELATRRVKLLEVFNKGAAIDAALMRAVATASHLPNGQNGSNRFAIRVCGASSGRGLL